MIVKNICIGMCLVLSLTMTPIWAQQANPAQQSSQTNTTTKSTAGQQQKSLPIEDIQRFSAALSQIKNYYVEPVKDKDLFTNAIRGMLSGLDPHSSYLDIEEFKDLQSSTTGEFGGLGIEVSMDEDVIKVIAPLDGTPAEKAGVKAGDLIIRLDDAPVQGMTLREAVTHMRGKKGSPLKLTIIREGEKQPITITVIRDVIKIQSVKSRIIDKKYGYLRISQFQNPTVNDVRKAINSLLKSSNNQLKGLVIDLRNNPGGLLTSAIDISDLFLDSRKLNKNKLIVYTKGRIRGSEFKANATPGELLPNIPIVVLINQGSASGSEIVAGALQDHKRAIILGKKSFGKGSVQTVLPLDSKRGLKLTTALYYTPKGRSIQAKGISPDVVVDALEIPEQNKKQKPWYLLKEADLEGHLANGNGAVENKATVQDKNKEKPLVHSDFQLYHALNMLKGMHVMNQ